MSRKDKYTSKDEFKYELNDKEKEDLLKELGLMYLKQMYAPQLANPFAPLATGIPGFGIPSQMYGQMPFSAMPFKADYSTLNQLLENELKYGYKKKEDLAEKAGKNYLSSFPASQYAGLFGQLNPLFTEIAEYGGTYEITIKYTVGGKSESKKDSKESTEYKSKN